jgi:integrase/recombinase XerD
LKLQATQILPMKTYLEELQVTSYKLQEITEEFTSNPYLFPIQKHSDTISKIVQQTKKQNPEIINSRQIRTSVIMNWLKNNNIRQVQYMTGHKKIKSTEHYRKHDLTDLSRQLELFHPLQ